MAAAQELLAELGEDGGWLDLEQTRTLLGATALSPAGVVAATADEAVRRAEEIGFPVAVKVLDPAVQHRTERGLVKVGLMSAADVAAAVAAFEEELGRPAQDVLVQPVVRGSSSPSASYAIPAWVRWSWSPRAASPPSSSTTGRSCCRR